MIKVILFIMLSMSLYGSFNGLMGGALISLIIAWLLHTFSKHIAELEKDAAAREAAPATLAKSPDVPKGSN